MDGARPVRSPRGTTLTARQWSTEAPLRMLMNNLDPEVAERPDDLVVYGGTGRAARDWKSFDAMVRTLTTLKADETMLVQSGRPVGVMQTHEWAPRVLIANSNLVGDWATWPEFRRLEHLGLTMYGQMTAGSWIYIGTQGIVQGTYETFAAVAEKRFGGTLAGTLTLTGGCGGMGGAQPLAVTMNEGVCLIVDVDPARLHRRVEHRYLDEVADDLDDAVEIAAEGQGRAPRLVGRRRRQRRRGLPRAAAPRRADRHRHRPDQRPRPAVATCPRASRSRTGPTTPRTSPRSSPTGPAPRWPGTCRRWSTSWTPAPRSSTTATRSATRPARAAASAPSTSRGSCRPTSARCSARARARSAGSRSPATPRTSPPPTRPCSTSSPTTTSCTSGSAAPRSASRSRGCRPGSAGSARASATRPAWRSTSWCAAGAVQAPIVIGRDHLDTGSVASPYRETESMLDGSDAIADWPLLNALVNTSSGASWVSIHHGGGVGIGRSLHAGPGLAGRRHRPRGAEARAGADQRPGDGRHPARRRGLRHRRAHGGRAGRPHPDARVLTPGARGR